MWRRGRASGRERERGRESDGARPTRGHGVNRLPG
jgi:hypothetical protein